MSLNDFLTLVIRGTFLLIAVVTLVDYLRYRDQARLDIALVFGALAVTIVIQVVTALTNLGTAAQWLNIFGSMAVVAHPHLLLRLVQHFRSVATVVWRVSIVGMLASWLLLIVFVPPLPALVTLAIVAYFVYIEGYATFAFIRGALRTGGITHWRLMLASAGSGLLAALILLAGVQAALPAFGAVISPTVQALAILSGLSYYFSFAPPRYLRQAWQLSELHRFLRENARQSPEVRARETLDTLCRAADRAVGGLAALVARWDEIDKELMVQASTEHALLPGTAMDDKMVARACREQRTLIARTPAEFGSDSARLARQINAGALIAVPIGTAYRAWRLLLVFLRRPPLFADDDLDLLALFAEQSAITLGYAALLGEQRDLVTQLQNELYKRKRAEEALATQAAELARSNAELEQFAYVASHDLQEPLRMVASYTELLADSYRGKLGADADEFIGFAVDGARRMRALINALLTYSRVGTRAKDFKPTDCNIVLDTTLTQLQMAIEESGALVTHERLPTLMADEAQLGQLFQNLISNAIKFRSEAAPRVHVSAELKGHEWVFAVRDNGIGIDPQYLDRIFVIFQRLHGRQEYPGTGIGLALCKKIVERHGGRIWVESQSGIGSNFYFTIPVRGN